MKKQSPPTMAPDHPLITVVVAMVALLGLMLLATRSGEPPQDSADAVQQSAQEDVQRPPASGEPDQLTVVDADGLVDVAEAELAYDGGIPASVSYPVIPNAEPLADFLDRALTREVDAFEAASPGARSYEAAWGITAANDGLVGVRMTSTETDSEGPHECHTTYWYETGTGQVHDSPALLAGQAELEDLNALVRETVPEEADPSVIHAISSLYDSVGFNPDGDLVVEFDAGQVAPTDQGRVHAVVDRDDAEPLLSELGTEIRDAATTAVEAFSVADAPEADKDGGADAATGVLPPAGDEVDCSGPDTKCVALTYDDGPGGGTPALLDTLAEYDARATFFVTGHPVIEDPRTVRRAYAEGHEIANHTLSHPDLTGLSASAARENLEAVQALVHRETGYTMDLMRPPYGATNDGVASVTEDLGLAQILWSVDTNDWKDRQAPVVANRALDGASDGAIILMHDIHPTSIAASSEIVRKLDERGFTMVTVSQLLGSTTPGEAYVDGVPDEPEPDEDEDDV